MTTLRYDGGPSGTVTDSLRCAVCSETPFLPVRLHRLGTGTCGHTSAQGRHPDVAPEDACDALACRMCVSELWPHGRCPGCGFVAVPAAVGVDAVYTRLLDDRSAVCTRCGQVDSPAGLLRHKDCNEARRWQLFVLHPVATSCDRPGSLCHTGRCVLVNFVLDALQKGEAGDAEWVVDHWLRQAMVSNPLYHCLPVHRDLQRQARAWYTGRWVRLAGAR